LKKDYNTQIYGHSLGAALAVLFALHLQSEGFKIEKVVTFGQPKVVKEKEAHQYRTLPITRVVDIHDPVPYLFPGYVHTGPEILLLSDQFYSSLKDHQEDATVPTKYDNNHIESYMRNLKAKLKTPISVAYEDRNELGKTIGVPKWSQCQLADWISIQLAKCFCID